MKTFKEYLDTIIEYLWVSVIFILLGSIWLFEKALVWFGYDTEQEDDYK